jgi:four helix bundle protein
MDKKIESFRDLIVWQRSHELVIQLIKDTKFSKSEQVTLARRLYEEATQIPTNIQLGFTKRGKRNKIHYYRGALISIERVKYLIILATDLNKLKNSTEKMDLLENVERMLKRLIRSITSNQ